MKCPLDNADLQMSERSGIEIDYCPQCRGVWLDRGELDKILERSAEVVPTTHQPTQVRSDYRPESGQYHHKKHKKDGFLSDIFDF